MADLDIPNTLLLLLLLALALPLPSWVVGMGDQADPPSRIAPDDDDLDAALRRGYW